MPEIPQGALRILDLYKQPRIAFQGVQFPMAISDVLLAESIKALKEEKAVFWLLDRRGLAGELHCADCGELLQCSRCGSSLVLEHGEMRCAVCGKKEKYVTRCPRCGGVLLQGKSPGLESLLPLAENLLNQKDSVFLWHAEDPSTKSEAKKRLAHLRKKGGLVLGSRRALSLLDEIVPRLICWLDADAEARQPHYQARFHACSMLLESLFRGIGERHVILQTRNPNQVFIRALQAGWGYFWRRELAERSQLSFPPAKHLITCAVPEKWPLPRDFMFQLEDAGFDLMSSDSSGRTFSILSPRMAPLRRYMEKYFTIQCSHRGYPDLQVWSE